MKRTAAHRSQRGFTLIELMITVSIIAILATIGLTVYVGVQRGARDAKRQADLQEIQKALEQFYAANRTYPAALSGIDSFFPSGVAPSDPLTTAAPYQYAHCASPEHYSLCTGAGAMETCTGTNRLNCNAIAPAAGGCGPYTAGTPSTSTLYCVGALSN